MPEEYDRRYAPLPEEYIASHAIVAMLSARLEWLTGTLINTVHAVLGWPISQKKWPYKFSERLRWLKEARKSESASEDVHKQGSLFLGAADRLNKARNDILHSAILGRAPDGRLYVARVTTDRKGDQLRLEEGQAGTIEVVKNVALDLVDVKASTRSRANRSNSSACLAAITPRSPATASTTASGRSSRNTHAPDFRRIILIGRTSRLG